MRIRSVCRALLSALLLVAAGCATRNALDDLTTAESGTPPMCPNWTYPELTGNTNNWVAAGCSKCAATEPGQSPIALDPSTADRSTGWKLPDPPQPAHYLQPLVLQTKGNNYKFAVNPNQGDPLRMYWQSGGIVWTLDEFHFHVPAEHAVVEQPVSVLEMHIQASGTQNGRPVAGVFAVQFAASTGSLNSLSAVAAAMEGGRNIPFDVTPYLEKFATRPTFIYTGSLTTPDCDWGVMFFVLKDPVPVDASSWLSITHSLLRLNGQLNARPLQARALTRPSSVALVNP